jgi:hypothetical protein
MMKQLLIPSLLAAGFGLAFAKLPPPDAATKAKTDETAAKAAWQAKVDAYQLCRAQDRAVAAFKRNAGKNGDKPAAPAAVAAAPAAAATGTPVTFSAPPPCTDPGPFAYNPPDQKPLETSGAHSPSGTAASPPSVKPESAQIAPAEKK